MNNIKGSLILLLAAFIWGTAFVAQTSGAGAVCYVIKMFIGQIILYIVLRIGVILMKRF